MPLFFPQQRASGSADTAVRRWRRKTPCLRARRMAACGGRECRCSPAGMPPSGGGDKRGQGHHMVPLPPLDSPKPSFALTHRRCAAKRGLRGLGSVRRADFGTLSSPEFSLRGLQRYQCAAIRCRATAFRCEKLRFDQGCTLGAPNVPVGPSHLDARPKGVAS